MGGGELMTQPTDWALKAGKEVCSRIGGVFFREKYPMPTVKMAMEIESTVASIIAAYAEPRIKELEALLRESKREHSDGEDMICATDYAAPERGPCDCGCDAWNARVEAVLGKPVSR
jgi:hypothetical protein